MCQIRVPVKHRDVVKNIKFIVTNIDTATISGRNNAVDLHWVKFPCHNCDQCNNDENMGVMSLSAYYHCKNYLNSCVRSAKLTLAHKPMMTQ